MSDATLDITEARKQFTKLDEMLAVDRVIWVTRHNKKAFAVVNTELLQTVLETIEVLSDPDASKLLQMSLQDIRAGRLHDHEDVKSELCNEPEGHHTMDDDSEKSPKRTSAKGPKRIHRKN
jgi:PHD/YefM family antitoxin component YafN of YafNO toxin-antitoxin module